MEVFDWDPVTRRSAIYVLRFKTESDHLAVARGFDIPYVFKKSNELLFNNGVTAYWYKSSVW